MIADVLVEYGAKSLDRTFSYIIPESLKSIKIGMKVLIPFGSQTIYGFVINIHKGDITNLKEIYRIDDEYLVLNQELLDLGKYLSSVTLCSLITSYQTMLPSSLKIKEQLTNYQLYDEYIELNDININNFILNNKRKTKQIEIINYLVDNQNVLKKMFVGIPLNNLIKNNIIRVVKKNKVRINPINNNGIKHELNNDQKQAINTITSSLNTSSIFLIHGVTGSGKTEIYLNLINEVLKNGKTAILLVPEISLTTQTVKHFYDWFGNDVAIFHSALSNGEKYDEYLKILNNEVHVVIGTRSAIFVPLNNLGIIIMDEEHSDNYKQENNPRYHAFDMAKYRKEYHHCPLVLGSATPSLESMARARKGVYTLIELKNRINNYELPKIKIIDMALEMKKRNIIFSEYLTKAINERLDKNEQIMLLLNRRGYSTIVTCQNCGYTYKCPNCDITLTYHKSTNNLRCHYCGYNQKKDIKCFHCHEEGLKDYGLGTEKLEKEISILFPNAKVVRMDTDTTSKKGMHEKIINDFDENKYDILLGTQMISKGLDFPKVSLVGIINADSSLNIPDYKSEERTYQLLEQVSGRAGRSGLSSEVIIQTFNKDNYVFKCLMEHNYDLYYNYAMNMRKCLNYPPYSYLIGIKIISKEYEEASLESNHVVNYLKNKLKNSIILGPTTASMFKVNNKYHFQIVIKYKKEANILNVLKEIDDIYVTNKKVNIEIDVNPNSI